MRHSEIGSVMTGDVARAPAGSERPAVHAVFRGWTAACGAAGGQPVPHRVRLGLETGGPYGEGHTALEAGRLAGRGFGEGA